MRLQTAAYLAIALHFLRTIRRKLVAPPRKRLKKSVPLNSAQYIIARIPEETVVVAKVNEGAEWADILLLDKIIKDSLDKCEVVFASEKQMAYIKEHENVFLYCMVPNSKLTHSGKAEFAKVIYNDAAFPESFLDLLELY